MVFLQPHPLGWGVSSLLCCHFSLVMAEMLGVRSCHTEAAAICHWHMLCPEGIELCWCQRK